MAATATSLDDEYCRSAHLEGARSGSVAADELSEDVRHCGDAGGGAVGGDRCCEVGAGTTHGRECVVEWGVVGEEGDGSPGRRRERLVPSVVVLEAVFYV